MKCYKVYGKDDCQYSIKWVLVVASSVLLAEVKAIEQFGYIYEKSKHEEQVANIIKKIDVVHKNVIDGTVLEFGY